jgi:hypothetical protein
MKNFGRKDETDFRDNIGVQELAKRVFPGMDNFPVNSMVPSVGFVKGKQKVSFLITADDEGIKGFRSSQGEIEVELTTFTRENPQGVGEDLVMRLDFYFPTGNKMFEAVIPGNHCGGQKHFVKALREVGRFVLWIGNKERVIENALNLNWDYCEHKATLEKLL